MNSNGVVVVGSRVKQVMAPRFGSIWTFSWSHLSSHPPAMLRD